MSERCSVVVADDNREAADTLVEILGAMGYLAVATYDGRQAVAACAALGPELAILDVQMPFLNGCEAAHLIRAGTKPPRTIASLSALRDWEEPMKSGGGAFDFRLAKPMQMDQLSALLQYAIGARPGFQV